MIKKKYNFVKIIYNDLYVYGRKRLILLILIVISSFFIVLVTHKTRCLIMDREKFFLEKHALHLEWNQLMMEKKKLSHHVRVEKIAMDKLQMRYIDPIIDNVYE